jgi:hypothetical protein
MFWQRLLYYLNPLTMFRKDKGDRPNINLKMMHGINRISIFLFLICMVLLIIRWVTR